MKKQLIIAVAITSVLAGCKPPEKKVPEEKATATATTVLKTEKQRVAYGMGISLGTRLKQEPIDIDVDAFTLGIKHAMNGEKPLMTREEIAQTIQAFQKKEVAKQREKMEKLAQKNKAEGEAFLAENAKKAGVVTTHSGLQYKILKKGTGKIPTANDVVKVNYSGKLIDGTEFDSSYKRHSPVTFPVNGVIPGWTEALQLMPVGSKWELYVPSDLAYGPGGTGGPIGPNATLIFQVELLGIKGQDDNKGAANSGSKAKVKKS